MTRLNKHLAHSTGISRREADDLIAAGRVIVNDQPAQLGKRIDAAHDRVVVDGTALTMTEYAYTYLMFHKPIGYVCSRRTQGETRTIYELLPAEYRALKPVGRLDKDSSGLLLLTDDGNVAHQMTHPSFHKTKTYEISLDQALQPLHRQMIGDHGIQLDDGSSQLQLERIDEGNDRDWIVQMHEGRNRQIRRTFAALGYTVTRLHRTQFGPLSLNDLPASEYQIISKP